MEKYGIFMSSSEKASLSLVSLMDSNSAANVSAFRTWLALGSDAHARVCVGCVDADRSIHYSARIRFEDADTKDCFDSVLMTAHRRYRVYGEEGHRQAVSFGQSSYCATRSFAMVALCSDVTGTNEYVDVDVYAPDIFACDETIEGQVWDGLFENSRVGRYVDLDSSDSPDMEQGAAKYRLEEYLRSYDMVQNYARDPHAPFEICKLANGNILVIGINDWNPDHDSAEGVLLIDPDTGDIIDKGWNTPDPCGCIFESGARWDATLSVDWTDVDVEDQVFRRKDGVYVETVVLDDTDIIPKAVVCALRNFAEESFSSDDLREARFEISRCSRLRIPLECS